VLAKIGRFAYVAPALAILAEPKNAEAYGKGPGRGYRGKSPKRNGPRGRKKK
jgi:hypothetical protein